MTGVITALEIQKRNKERVNLFIDDEFAFGLSIIAAAGLRKGQTLTEDEIAALRDSDAVQQAVDRAARFLAYRPRSIYEVRQNLAQKDVSEATIEAAIERLAALGYVDDLAFARFWVQNRREFKPLGPFALRHELRQKGVDDQTIETVVSDLDAEDEAYRAAQSRVRRLRGLTQHEFRQKLGGFLQRRGFTYSTARSVTDQLVEELTSDETDYFQEIDA